MRTLLGSCTLLLATSAGIFAQSANTGSAVMRQQPISLNCPVSLHAGHLAGGVMERATDARHPEGKPLQVTFRPNDANGIVHADLVLHGMFGTHVVPAGSLAARNSTESFLVSPAQARDHHYDAIVYPRKLTAVDYLELQSITFADGTICHPSVTSTCRVAPDGYMLVAAGN